MVVTIAALESPRRRLRSDLTRSLELDRCGVEVVSLGEPWLHTGGPVHSLPIAIFGWVAEQERVRLGERTRAGLARARRDGIRLGRPATRIDLRLARKLQQEGLAVRAIAKRLKVPPSTLHRGLAAAASTSTHRHRQARRLHHVAEGRDRRLRRRWRSRTSRRAPSILQSGFGPLACPR
jgi:putative DNA-invertase from lambdoid prophage Rac